MNPQQPQENQPIPSTPPNNDLSLGTNDSSVSPALPVLDTTVPQSTDSSATLDSTAVNVDAPALSATDQLAASASPTGGLGVSVGNAAPQSLDEPAAPGVFGSATTSATVATPQAATVDAASPGVGALSDPQNLQQPGFGAPTSTVVSGGAPVADSKSKAFAITSLVLGILSIIPPGAFIPIVNIVVMITAVIAIVFGILAVNKVKAGVGEGKGMAIAGIVTGAIALVISLAVTVGSVMFIDSTKKSYDSTFPEDGQYGTMTVTEANAAAEIGMTKDEVTEALGGVPKCEVTGSKEQCAYTGGNLQRGVKLDAGFNNGKLESIAGSSLQFN